MVRRGREKSILLCACHRMCDTIMGVTIANRLLVLQAQTYSHYQHICENRKHVRRYHHLTFALNCYGFMSGHLGLPFQACLELRPSEGNRTSTLDLPGLCLQRKSPKKLPDASRWGLTRARRWTTANTVTRKVSGSTWTAPLGHRKACRAVVQLSVRMVVHPYARVSVRSSGLSSK